jgi:hypothetical protein
MRSELVNVRFSADALSFALLLPGVEFHLVWLGQETGHSAFSDRL